MLWLRNQKLWDLFTLPWPEPLLWSKTCARHGDPSESSFCPQRAESLMEKLFWKPFTDSQGEPGVQAREA